MTIRWRAELAAFFTLLIVYVATLAPSVTLWDSGEFLSAIHSLGIPHPPGTPLYVLVANVWASIFSPIVGFAYSVNLLSAVCTAAACALFANLFVRWTGDELAAYAAAVCAGGMSTVWLSATETEVYAAALLTGVLILWFANRSSEIADQTSLIGDRRLLLASFVAGLGFTLHLTALLTLPAAIYLVFSRRASFRVIAPALLVFLLGASAVLFMLIRARHDPFVNQGNPSTLASLTDVLMRRQYMPAAPWPRQAPMFIQLGNLIEYSDWQFALSLAPDPPPTIARTTITLAFVVLGGFGFLEHRRMNRRSWIAMLILFLTTTVGVLAYLNLKAGPSFGGHFIPATAKHEARERDYFFALGFICWGLWAGFGAVRIARRFATKFPSFVPLAALAAFIPVLLNWSAVSRRMGPGASEARRIAEDIGKRAPQRAVVFAHGDNEVYPVWYLQEVEHMRRDMTIVVVPLLPAAWYRQELARRENLLSPDSTREWRGTSRIVASICAGARMQGRPVMNARDSSTVRPASPCS